MTLLLIAITFFLAFSLSYFWYKAKRSTGGLFWTLFILRGLALWILAILLINPLLKKYAYISERPSLYVLVDNSSSMAQLSEPEKVLKTINDLKNDRDLNEGFDLHFYSFGQDLNLMDTVPGFNESRTDIAGAFKRLNKLSSSHPGAAILISDGNATFGADYQYNTFGWQGPVYTVVAGDTTSRRDLMIERVNANRYAYANNRFPIEVFTGVQGKADAVTRLEVLQGDRVVFKKDIRIRSGEAAAPQQIELEAGEPGLKRYRIVLTPLEGERNITNNRYDLAVEVIGQRNRIAVVSNGAHPDLGALKKMLEKEGQREITLLKPLEARSAEDYDLFILFAPDRNFSSVFDALNKAKKNYLILGGEGTDWNSVNGFQDRFSREVVYTTEMTQARVNMKFGEFRFDDPKISGAPPINSYLGDFIINSAYQVLLFKTINGFESERPLLFTLDDSGRRIAVMDGSELWKWRLWYYTENEDFLNFDAFWNKLMQYLLTGIRKDRLDVSYDAFYYANSPVSIRAGYYDKNFMFDPTEVLEISVKHTDSLTAVVSPMRAGEQGYRADLNRLSPGDYEFVVNVPAQGLRTSGQFTILEFDVEKQFVNTDNQRMKTLAERTQGAFIVIDEMAGIRSDLLQDERFRTVQKEKEEVVSLIDLPWMLLALALLLGSEWIIRKYNGLI